MVNNFFSSVISLNTSQTNEIEREKAFLWPLFKYYINNISNTFHLLLLYGINKLSIYQKLFENFSLISSQDILKLFHIFFYVLISTWCLYWTRRGGRTRREDKNWAEVQEATEQRGKKKEKNFSPTWNSSWNINKTWNLCFIYVSLLQEQYLYISFLMSAPQNVNKAFFIFLSAHP